MFRVPCPVIAIAHAADDTTPTRLVFHQGNYQARMLLGDLIAALESRNNIKEG